MAASCPEHTCQYMNEYRERRQRPQDETQLGQYCFLHACGEQGCNDRAARPGEVCRNHVCMVQDCVTPRDANNGAYSTFCLSHRGRPSIFKILTSTRLLGEQDRWPERCCTRANETLREILRQGLLHLWTSQLNQQSQVCRVKFVPFTRVHMRVIGQPILTLLRALSVRNCLYSS